MMPPEAPAAAARALGLSLKALAAEIGIHWTTLYRYTRGEAPIPQTVALAIECLLRRKGLYAEEVEGFAAVTSRLAKAAQMEPGSEGWHYTLLMAIVALKRMIGNNAA